MNCLIHPKYKGISEPNPDCPFCEKIRRTRLLAREINGSLFGNSIIGSEIDFFAVIGIIAEEIENFEYKEINEFSKYDLSEREDDDVGEQEHEKEYGEDED
jgi:hypothetical protein